MIDSKLLFAWVGSTSARGPNLDLLSNLIRAHLVFDAAGTHQCLRLEWSPRTAHDILHVCSGCSVVLVCARWTQRMSHPQVPEDGRAAKSSYSFLSVCIFWRDKSSVRLLTSKSVLGSPACRGSHHDCLPIPDASTAGCDDLKPTK